MAKDSYEYEGGGFGDDLDYNDFSKPRPKTTVGKVRQAVGEVASQGFETAFNDFTSVDKWKQSVIKDLPSPHKYIYDSYTQVTDTGAELYDQVTKEVRPILGGLSKKLDDMVSEDSFLKKVTSGLREKFYDAPVRSPGETEILEASLKRVMDETFGGLDALMEERSNTQEQKQTARDVTGQVMGQEQHEDLKNFLSPMVNATKKLETFKLQIESKFMRKDTELMFRSYMLQGKLYEHSKKSHLEMMEQIRAVVTNTSLPEYAKIERTERFKEMMRDRLMGGAQDLIFGDESPFGALLNKIKRSANEALSGFKMGLEQLAMTAETAESMFGADSPMTAFESVGMILGGEISAKARAKVLEPIMKKLQENEDFMKLGHKGQSLLKDPRLLFKYIKRNDKIMEFMENTGSGDSNLKFLFEDLERGIAPRRNFKSFTTGVEAINQPVHSFTNRFARTVEDIIPGYLARILQQVTTTATGKPAPLMVYDHTRNNFTTKEGMTNKISKTLQEYYTTKSGYLSAADSGAGELLDPLGLQQEDREALRAALAILASDKNILSGEGKASRLEGWAGATDAERRILERIDTFMGVDGTLAQLETKNKIISAYQEVAARGDNAGALLQRIQDEGHMDILHELGVLKFDKETPGRIKSNREYLEKLQYDALYGSKGQARAIEEDTFMRTAMASGRSKEEAEKDYRKKREEIFLNIYIEAAKKRGLSEKEARKGFKEHLDAKAIDLTISEGDFKADLEGGQIELKSDINAKKNIKQVNPQEALRATMATNVNQTWTYKDDNRQTPKVKWGPMAQDLRREFGEDVAPNGEAIDLVSMNGALMSSIQEVARRQEAGGQNPFVSLIAKAVGVGVPNTHATNAITLVDYAHLTLEEIKKTNHILDTKTFGFGLGTIDLEQLKQMFPDMTPEQLKEMASKAMVAGKEKAEGFVNPLLETGNKYLDGFQSLVGSLIQDTWSGAGVAYDKGKGYAKTAKKYGIDKPTDWIMDFLMRNEKEIKDRKEWLWKKSIEAAGSAVDFGTKLISEKIPAALKGGFDFMRRIKDGAKRILNPARDVFIPGQTEPAMRAQRMKTRSYMDEAGKFIVGIDDLMNATGNIKDVHLDIIVLTEADRADGLLDIDGNELRTTGDLALGLGAAAAKGLWSVGKKGYEWLKEGPSILDKAKGAYDYIKTGASNMWDHLAGIGSFGTDARLLRLTAQIRDLLAIDKPKKMVAKIYNRDLKTHPLEGKEWLAMLYGQRYADKLFGKGRTSPTAPPSTGGATGSSTPPPDTGEGVVDKVGNKLKDVGKNLDPNKSVWENFKDFFQRSGGDATGLQDAKDAISNGVANNKVVKALKNQIAEDANAPKKPGLFNRLKNRFGRKQTGPMSLEEELARAIDQDSDDYVRNNKGEEVLPDRKTARVRRGKITPKPILHSQSPDVEDDSHGEEDEGEEEDNKVKPPKSEQTKGRRRKNRKGKRQRNRKKSMRENYERRSSEKELMEDIESKSSPEADKEESPKTALKKPKTWREKIREKVLRHQVEKDLSKAIEEDAEDYVAESVEAPGSAQRRRGRLGRLKDRVSRSKTMGRIRGVGRWGKRLGLGGIAASAIGGIGSLLLGGQEGQDPSIRTADVADIHTVRDRKVTATRDNTSGKANHYDADGDGVRDNGATARLIELNQERQERQEKENEKARRSQEEAQRLLEEKNHREDGVMNGMMGMLGNLFSFFTTRFGGLFKGLGLLGKGIWGLAKGGWAIAKGGTKLVGKGLKWAGKSAIGSIAKHGAARGATTGLGMALKGTLPALRAGLGVAGVAGLASGGAVGSALGIAALAARIALGPVGLGLTAAYYGIKGLAWGYKRLTRNRVDNFGSLRMAQYGLTPENKDEYHKFLAVEELVKPQVSWSDDVPTILGQNIKYEDLMDIFDCDKNNEEHATRIGEWFENRFKPFLINSLIAVKSIDPKAKYLDLDLSKLTQEQLTTLSEKLEMKHGPYDSDTSPFKVESALPNTLTLVKSMADKIKSMPGKKTKKGSAGDQIDNLEADLREKTKKDNEKKRVEGRLKQEDELKTMEKHANEERVLAEKSRLEMQKERDILMQKAQERTAISNRAALDIQAAAQGRTVADLYRDENNKLLNDPHRLQNPVTPPTNTLGKSEAPSHSDDGGREEKGSKSSENQGENQGGEPTPAVGPLPKDVGPRADPENGKSAYALNKSSINVQGLHPKLKDNFFSMAAEYQEKTGNKILVTDAKRSTEEQRRLYESLPKGKAAKPGSSLHEYGAAIDVNSPDANKLEKLGLMRKYGFTRPVGGEPWHIEPAGIQGNLHRAKNDPMFLSQAIDASLGRGGGGLGTMPNARKYSRNTALAIKLFGEEGFTPVEKEASTVAAGLPEPLPAPASNTTQTTVAPPKGYQQQGLPDPTVDPIPSTQTQPVPTVASPSSSGDSWKSEVTIDGKKVSEMDKASNDGWKSEVTIDGQKVGDLDKVSKDDWKSQVEIDGKKIGSESEKAPSINAPGMTAASKSAYEDFLNKRNNPEARKKSEPEPEKKEEVKPPKMSADTKSAYDDFLRKRNGGEPPKGPDPNAGIRDLDHYKKQGPVYEPYKVPEKKKLANPTTVQEYLDAISEFSKEVGKHDPRILQIFAAMESSLGKNLAAGNTSAKGPFQFVDKTWREQVGKHGKKYNITPSTHPNDLRASTILASEYLSFNEPAVKAIRGSSFDIVDAYMTHLLGKGGASVFARLKDTDIASRQMPSAASNNKPIFYENGRPRTAGEVRTYMLKRMDKVASTYGISMNGLREAIDPNGKGQVTTGAASNDPMFSTKGYGPEGSNENVTQGNYSSQTSSPNVETKGVDSYTPSGGVYGNYTGPEVITSVEDSNRFTEKEDVQRQDRVRTELDQRRVDQEYDSAAPPPKLNKKPDPIQVNDVGVAGLREVMSGQNKTQDELVTIHKESIVPLLTNIDGQLATLLKMYGDRTKEQQVQPGTEPTPTQQSAPSRTEIPKSSIQRTRRYGT